ncbi:MAG: hypothetical protein AAB496_02035, partial [Patescibacteria group bacterium]
MNNLFQNKFFIIFLILVIAIYGLSTKVAQAKGSFNWLNYIIIAVVVVSAPYLIPSLGILPLTTLAEIGIGASFVTCQFGSDSAFWSGCGGSIGGITITAPMLIPGVQGECR